MRSAIDTAAFLDALRLGDASSPTLPAEHMPPSEAAAYDAQAVLVDRLLARYGGQRNGFKIACTNEHAQVLLGASGPAAGVMFTALTHASPARLDAGRFNHRVIEAEFAFRMASDVPPGEYTAQSIAAYVAALLPAIEVVDHRFAGLDQFNSRSLIADNAIHGAFVHGEPVSDFDAMALDQARVTLRVNGDIAREGSGSAVLGHPLNALAWLANHLGQRGESLRADDLVTTGTCLDVYPANAGDDVVADFGRYGEACVRFD